jgi:hypothetical protein
MNTPRRRTLLTLVLSLAALPLVAAETAPPAPPAVEAPKLPAGDTIVDRSFDATGGEKHGGVRTRLIRGTLSLPGMGITGPITVWQKEPNLIHTQADVEGIGSIVTGYDGKVMWQQDPMTGPRIIEGVERATQLRSAEIDPRSWRKFYSSAETVAVEDVAGKPAYKVVLTPQEGTPVTNWFDVESGLLVKAELVAETHMGTIPMVTWYEDYEEADGVLSPRLVRQEAMGIEQRFTFEVFETNVELPADRFDLPPDIAALAAKDGAADGTPAAETPKDDPGTAPRSADDPSPEKGSAASERPAGATGGGTPRG